MDRIRPNGTAAMLTPGDRLWVGGHNTSAKGRIAPMVAGYVRPPTGRLDAAIVVPLTVDEAVYFAQKLIDRITPTGAIGVVVAANSPEFTESPTTDGVCAGFSGLGFSVAATERLDGDFELLVFRRRS